MPRPRDLVAVRLRVGLQVASSCPPPRPHCDCTSLEFLFLFLNGLPSSASSGSNSCGLDRTMSYNANYPQQPQYQPQYQPPPQPGYSAPYAQAQPYPPQSTNGGAHNSGAAPQWYSTKNEEYGTVMQPKKKKFNDVIPLVLFLLTVRPLVLLGGGSFDGNRSSGSSGPGGRVYSRQRTRTLVVCTTRSSKQRRCRQWYCYRFDVDSQLVCLQPVLVSSRL